MLADLAPTPDRHGAAGTAPGSRFDVACLGELMIDLVPEPSPDRTLRFAARPGGAPGNVAVAASRLGLRTAMLSRVGRESFGRLLLSVLAEAGVDHSGVVQAEHRSTGLAVVTLTPEGERDFFFYRDACADVDFGPGEVDASILRRTRILSVGSLFLARPASAMAQRHAVAVARDAGALVAADPNFRPPLWPDPVAMADAGREVVAAAQVVKLSAEELGAMAGPGDTREAVARLWHDGLALLAVTHGRKGADLFTARDHAWVQGFPVETVDTVGCGDAFMAAMLAGLLGCGGAPDGRDLHRIGIIACAAGAIAASRAGGMDSLPTRAELDVFVASRL